MNLQMSRNNIPLKESAPKFNHHLNLAELKPFKTIPMGAKIYVLSKSLEVVGGADLESIFITDGESDGKKS